MDGVRLAAAPKPDFQTVERFVDKVRDIVAGERNPDVLATYRDVCCHSSAETIRAALVGNDRAEHVFALTQSLELYDIYQAKMLECDRKLEVLVAALSSKGAKPIGKLTKARIKTKQVNAPTFDVRTALYGTRRRPH